MKPSNVPTGRVTGRFIIGVEDGPDPDDEPDYIAAKGTIELQMSVPYIPNPTADPVPVTMLNARRRLVLDAEGYACTPNADGTAGVRDMRLEADGSPDALVSGWTWNVTYRFDPVNGSAPSIPAHSFVMLPGETVDLTTAIKVPSSPGYGLPQSEAAVLRAEAAAVDSAQSATAAQGASDLIIEMAETGRLSPTALIDTIGELSGPVIAAQVAPVLATAQDVVDRANAGDFDGADGNPTAFELRGTGSPLGVVSAPPGTYYTDTAGTIGAWRWLKKTGTGASGWDVIEGDTDWRDMSAYAGPEMYIDPATPGGSFLRMKRVGQLVHVAVRLKVVSGGSAGKMLTFAQGLPQQFSPYATYGSIGVLLPYGKAVISVDNANTSSALQAGAPGVTLSAGDVVSGQLTYQPFSRNWPTAYPGNPA